MQTALKFIIALFVSISPAMAQLGTNLDGISDYSTAIPLADAAKSARCIGSPAAAYDCKFGSVIPAEDFGMLIHTGVPGLEGTYKLKFNGHADLSFPASSAAVQNQKFDGSVTTADLILSKDSQLYITFKNTAGSVSNVSLLRPGVMNETFTPMFVEGVKPYKAIRFMDWLHTNSNPVVKWSERRLPTDQTQTGEKGIAWEYIIQLLNQTKKDGWINIPALADDDYVLQLAKLLKEKLDPSLKIYVEYSNEVWNTIFKQFNQNLEAAKAEVAAGDTTLQLEKPTDTNQFYWARRRVAKRTLKIRQIFESVFGSDMSRVRMVLAGQMGDVSVGKAELDYVSKYAGAPVASKLYGYAIAPYFACCNSDADGTLTRDAIVTRLATSVASNVAMFDQNGTNTNASLAKQYGIKHLAYEGGQHVIADAKGADNANFAVKLEIQSSPEMGKDYEDYLTGWFKQGGAEFMHFVGPVGGWSKHGFWGLQRTYQISTPKSEAVKRVAAIYNAPAADPKDQQISDLKAKVSSLEALVSEGAAQLKFCASDLQTAKLANQSAMASLDACRQDSQKSKDTLDKIKSLVAQ